MRYLFLLLMPVLVFGASINVPQQFLDTSLDSVRIIGVHTTDWAWDDTTSYTKLVSSFPDKTYITLDDSYNWMLIYRWYYPGTELSSSAFLPLAASGVTLQQTDSILSLEFQSGATLDSSEIASNAITSNHISDNAITISENSAIRYMMMWAGWYPGVTSKTIFGADQDSLVIIDTTGNDIGYILFKHPGGEAGGAPDSTRTGE